jgi:lipoate-protein ligase B
MAEQNRSGLGPFLIRDLGRRPYTQVLALQHDLVRARQDQELEHDVLLLVEHDAVFTLGRRGRRDSLLVSEAFLNQQGIAVEHVERGGDITYHGPGQLVAYLIMDLRRAGLRVTSFVANMEEAMLRTAEDTGVLARTDPSNRGIWVAQRKLGSVGIALRHGITFHGLAFNVNTDLTPFSYINPCGLAGVSMTSLALETGQIQDFPSIKESLAAHMQNVFALDLGRNSTRERSNL